MIIMAEKESEFGKRMTDAEFTFTKGEISQDRMEQIKKSIRRGRREQNAKR